ncbi:XRE family transcriptional regulator [Facklamia hominis]|uniref:helix-turn-helix domain-containing protein n=1 Tax=Facklamia hominis TaxID=178214 RepID=UPI0015E0BD76|nr:XRE family transcriptional regulator [Facklamia hominis]
MALGKIIKDYRSRNSLSMDDFAKKSQLSKAYISVLEKNEDPRTGKPISPTITTIKKVADGMDISFDELFSMLNDEDVVAFDGYSVPEKIFDISKKISHDRQLKVYNFAQYQLVEQNRANTLDEIKEEPAEYITEGLYGRLSAGTGQQIFDNPVEDVKVPSAIIPDEPYDIMLKIVGDSMQPAFEDGEYVFIKLTKEIRSGQFAAIIVDGEAFLKKVYVEENQMRLVSLNKNYEDIIVNEYSNVEVVGTVVL